MARIPKGARIFTEAKPGAQSKRLEPRRAKKRLKDKIFSPALGSLLCNEVATGLTRSAAAGRAGITPQMLAAWLRLSEAGDLPNSEGYAFYEEFVIAEVEGQALHEEHLLGMARDKNVKSANLRAQQIFLQGRYADWNPKKTVEHTGKVSGTIGVMHGTIADFLKSAYDAEKEEQSYERQKHQLGADKSKDRVVETTAVPLIDPLEQLRAELVG